MLQKELENSQQSLEPLKNSYGIKECVLESLTPHYNIGEPLKAAISFCLLFLATRERGCILLVLDVFLYCPFISVYFLYSSGRLFGSLRG